MTLVRCCGMLHTIQLTPNPHFKNWSSDPKRTSDLTKAQVTESGSPIQHSLLSYTLEVHSLPVLCRWLGDEIPY